eukprot:scaffold2051_cov389-Prasinococcus_capsulatus_cf.AAC.1
MPACKLGPAADPTGKRYLHLCSAHVRVSSQLRLQPHSSLRPSPPVCVPTSTAGCVAQRRAGHATSTAEIRDDSRGPVSPPRCDGAAAGAADDVAERAGRGEARRGPRPAVALGERAGAWSSAARRSRAGLAPVVARRPPRRG